MEKDFVVFCATNSLMAITSTAFSHQDIRKYLMVKPVIQTDHMVVNSRFKESVSDTRSYRGTDISSDHNLVVAVINLSFVESLGEPFTHCSSSCYQ